MTLIKVSFNDEKCYICNDNNFSDIKRDGSAKCNNCCIKIVLFDFITEKEYKNIYLLSDKPLKIIQAGANPIYNDNFCTII